MTTTSRRQSFTLGVPPLPSSKKQSVAKKSAQRQIMENAQDELVSTSVDFSTQRGELPLDDRGAFVASASANAMQACETNRTVGQQTHNNSLKRRRSLPAATESVPNRHFLQGVALDKCTNLLSLPDPPSPPKRFPKRRATDTFVPLRDLSNGDKKAIPASPISNSSSMMSKRSGASLTHQNHHCRPKRSRLSLPNMASPLVSKKSAASSAAKTARARDDSAVPMMETTRTSITPPLHAPPHRQNSRSITSHAQDSGTTSFQAYKKAPPKKAALDVYQIPTQPDTESLMKIRTLVHAYTALPVEKRFESDEAKAIEAASGYPLVPSYVPAHAVSRESRLDRRNHIIANLSTRMKDAEGCKTRDVHLMESVTQCRVQKVRGGHVEYKHIPTGRSVPPQEFEARYMCMINEVSAVRKKSWGDYFAKLTQQVKAQRTVGLAKEEEEESAQPAKSSSSSPPTDTMDDASQEDESSAIPEASSNDDGKKEGNPVEEIQTLGASNSVTHDPEGEDLCAEVIYKTIDSTQTQPEDTKRTTPDKKLPRAPSPTSPDMLLPFPSRDQPSSNVLIARAEQELWTTIDTALATYSQKVLEIQAAQTRTTK